MVEKTKWREDLARLLPIVSLLRSDHNDIKSRAQRNIELMRGFVCESVKSLGNSIERRERHWERKCEEIADKLREVIPQEKLLVIVHFLLIGFFGFWQRETKV